MSAKIQNPKYQMKKSNKIQQKIQPEITCAKNPKTTSNQEDTRSRINVRNTGREHSRPTDNQMSGCAPTQVLQMRNRSSLLCYQAVIDSTAE